MPCFPCKTPQKVAPSRDRPLRAHPTPKMPCRLRWWLPSAVKILLVEGESSSKEQSCRREPWACFFTLLHSPLCQNARGGEGGGGGGALAFRIVGLGFFNCSFFFLLFKLLFFPEVFAFLFVCFICFGWGFFSTSFLFFCCVFFFGLGGCLFKSWGLFCFAVWWGFLCFSVLLRFGDFLSFPAF